MTVLGLLRADLSPLLTPDKNQLLAWEGLPLLLLGDGTTRKRRIKKSLYGVETRTWKVGLKINKISFY